MKNVRSAINNVVSIPSCEDISQHFLVKRFMKGYYNIAPPSTRVAYTWDANRVLQYLHSLGENKDLSFPSLCRKLVTLLMMLAGTRVNSLQAFSRDRMSLTSKDCTFIPVGLLKHSRDGYKQDPMIYSSYPHNMRLCPVQVISEYILRRDEYAEANTVSFFVISRKPYSGASKDTLARWIKEVLKAAGIATCFTAHSCRGASTSYASRAKVPLATILKHGDWSNAKTFFKHYCKEIMYIEKDDSFASSLLDNIVI